MIQLNTTKREYRSISKSGIDRSLAPMKLFEKAKKLGVWNPADIDFTQDKEDWIKLSENEKDYLLNLVTPFLAGEECVSHDNQPMISCMAKQGRLEDEMYLSTFLWEEVKHMDFFRRYLDDVVSIDRDLYEYIRPAYKALLMDRLEEVMSRLWTDQSPEAIIDASVVYNMIIEGVLAETGYHTFYEVLDRNNIMPGLRKGVALIQRDESRHIGYGVYLLSRIIQDRPDLLPYLEERMAEVQVMAMAQIQEGIDRYGEDEEIPFGMPGNFGEEYALTRYQGRMSVIMRSQKKSKKEVESQDYELMGSLAGSTS